MKKWFVYYRKDSTMREWGKCGETGFIAFYNHTYNCCEVADLFAFVGMQWAEDKDHVFATMQGEVWSPNGEARDLIRGLGLRHTSMSVGDLVMDEQGNVFEVAPFGWNEVPVLS
jgi:hypothetical protein